MQEVRGSIPLGSTNFLKFHVVNAQFLCALEIFASTPLAPFV